MVLLNVSRSFLKKNLSKKILSHPVRARQVVSYPLDIMNHGMIFFDYIGPEVKILYQDQNFMALSKPAFVHIHPLEYDSPDNLLTYLRKNNYFDLLQVNKNNYDRGILFRLDYETSGVVLVAKNDLVYSQVRHSFQTLMKRKIYRAVVQGMIDEELELTSKLALTCGGTKVRVDHNEGEEASLKLKRLAYSPAHQLSLIEIDLKTGFRHQIRAQLSAIDHPILGDQLYGGDNANRLFLHAMDYQLEWEENTLEVTDPMPSEFMQFFI